MILGRSPQEMTKIRAMDVREEISPPVSTTKKKPVTTMTSSKDILAVTLFLKKSSSSPAHMGKTKARTKTRTKTRTRWFVADVSVLQQGKVQSILHFRYSLSSPSAGPRRGEGRLPLPSFSSVGRGSSPLPSFSSVGRGSSPLDDDVSALQQEPVMVPLYKPPLEPNGVCDQPSRSDGGEGRRGEERLPLPSCVGRGSSPLPTLL